MPIRVALNEAFSNLDHSDLQTPKPCSILSGWSVKYLPWTAALNLSVLSDKKNHRNASCRSTASWRVPLCIYRWSHEIVHFWNVQLQLLPLPGLLWSADIWGQEGPCALRPLEDGCFNAWLMDIKICISQGSARAQTLVAETTSS